ncbi:hypothetical protein BDV38DRAFT_255295 [Aspergillus pseudotamarii]|uniref:Uncharacterized protein n=1 Tax=Aspergillus pseudotamarii TaxID=132259 RepID=A0A5N6SLY2_ASPPS|nr:uncharacterized protein BDV38DRAFT_255295 [Aspergillus pseudotamarii]KAE8134373.1 hypothetical protein BDV38DRAFT_255295 [Aspergillus pseudotamarii]
MADNEHSNSGENTGIHPTDSLPILQVPSLASNDPLAHQYQAPAQESDVWPASELQLPLDYQKYYTEHPPMASPTTQSAVRQHRCHHSVMERQFCIDRTETCNSCGRRPFLGWLYLCVEDISGFSDPLDPINGPFLSPWILKAMEDGHYTTEQKEIVIHQKLNVVRMAERERGPVPPPLSMLYAERSALNGHNQDDPWVELVEDVSPRDESAPKTSESAVRLDRPELASQVPQPSHPSRPCTFKACRYCERRHGNLEERTWISLNEICNDPSIPPPDSWELLERPVSDANILRNLELPSRRIWIGSSGASSSGYDIAESREDISARLYSQENITSTNLHELLNQSLNISVRTEQTIASYTSQLSESIVIGQALSAFDDHSTSFPLSDSLEHGHDECNTGG